MSINNLPQTNGKIRLALRYIVFCLRGFLLPIGFFSFLIITYKLDVKALWDHDHILIGGLLLFLGVPYAGYLGLRQIVRDVLASRRRYAYSLYKSVKHEISSSGSNDSFLIPYFQLETTPTNIYVWDSSNHEVFNSVESYLDSYQHREDFYAQQMQMALSKNSMKELISTSIVNSQSIRIWKDKGLISINFETPIHISDILSLELLNDYTIQKGETFRDEYTTHRGYSYNNVIGIRKYRGKSHSHTRYHSLPDRKINNFRMMLTLRNPDCPHLCIELGNKQELAYELKSQLLNLKSSTANKNSINYKIND